MTTPKSLDERIVEYKNAENDQEYYEHFYRDIVENGDSFIDGLIADRQRLLDELAELTSIKEKYKIAMESESFVYATKLKAENEKMKAALQEALKALTACTCILGGPDPEDMWPLREEAKHRINKILEQNKQKDESDK